MNRVIVELNELEPDAVVCTGDLTNEGYRQEYKNCIAYLSRIRAPVHIVPGNHDARNVGYVHFEELIGDRYWIRDIRGVRVVGADSSEPDLNEVKISRRYPFGGQTVLAHFSLSTGQQYFRELEKLIQEPVDRVDVRSRSSLE